jgi:hypothetical protein
MSVVARHSIIQQAYAAVGHTATHSLTRRDTVKGKMPLKECGPNWISNLQTLITGMPNFISRSL